MPETEKLIALSRTARTRVNAEHGAAVMDESGRSYVGCDVVLPSLRLTALQLAVAQAIAAGAQRFESVVIVGVAATLTHSDRHVLRDVGAEGLEVTLADTSGNIVSAVKV